LPVDAVASGNDETYRAILFAPDRRSESLGLSEHYQSLFTHGPNQAKYIDELLAKTSLRKLDVLFLVTELSRQGIPQFPKYHSLYLEQDISAKLKKYAESKMLEWQAITSIPGFLELFRNSKARENLYSYNTPYFEKGKKYPGILFVVFTTMFNNFGMSNLALICLLRRIGISVLLLKDTSQKNYLIGIPGFGGDFSTSLKNLQNFIEKNNFRKTYFLGYSSSGFSSLFAAETVGCDGYLGFSIRSNLHPNSKIPISEYLKEVRPSIPKSLQLNLREIIRKSNANFPVRLIYGEKAWLDSMHATNLAKSSRVTIKIIARCRHETVLHQLAHNELLDELRSII
jgi:hypothetical protein